MAYLSLRNVSLTTSSLNVSSLTMNNATFSTLTGSTITDRTTSASTITASTITGPLGTASAPGVVQIGSGLTVSSGTVTIPYFVWHFNWNVAQSSATIVGSTGLMGGYNNTNISGTYINTPSSGRLTIPISGVYICTFDCAGGSANFNTVLLRVDGTYYNPYKAWVGSYLQMTFTEILYLTAGQVIDFYCNNGSTQVTSVLASGQGSGNGINFALLH